MDTIELITRLEKVREHLLAHDGWTRADHDTLNDAIEFLDTLRVVHLAIQDLTIPETGE